MERKKRLGELDALRGLAALAVVLYHYTTFYDDSFGHKENLLFNFKYGYFGVHLFFIISGFVIYMTLTKTKNIKEFAIKRAIRLYPAYIVAATLTFIITSLYVLESLKVSTNIFLINITMFQGVLPIGIKNVDGSYWSLGIEITFYIICCILFSLKLIQKPIFLSILFLSVIYIVKTLYIYNFLHPLIGDLGIVNYSNLFIAGILFYQLRNGKHKIIHMLIFSALLYQFLFQGLLSGIAVSISFLVFYGILYDKLKFLNTRILIYFGTISYSLYLVHQSIGFIIIHFLEGAGITNSFLVVFIPLLISILLASLITHFIEKPFQRTIRNRSVSNKNKKRSLKQVPKTT
ncbi:acyltransferase family protein [Peribacillus sp. NPDC097295]|uniref:acyltransferase family protein n=1 Tax=Peribacillus sp. NPDC097295 TaxID=3364402 RepID=UPI003805A09D